MDSGRGGGPVTVAEPTSAPPRRSLAGALGRLVLRRLLLAVPVLAAVSATIFVLGKASPFDPVASYFGVRILRASPEQVAQIRQDWGADDPALVQYGRWLKHLLSGDLGDSRTFGLPVATLIGDRLGWSALLAGTGLLLALALALLAGTAAAWHRGGWFDRAVSSVAYTLEATPVFWLALGALSLFAVRLRWLPAAGLTDPGADISAAQVAEHLILPAAVLGVAQAPWFLLFIRESVAHGLTQDYVLGARARGLGERTVVLRHALRTGLLPLITLVGARVPELITGAVLVEAVFSWPGVAAATVTAATTVDFALLAALTLLGTVSVLVGNLLADIGYSIADPRVRADG
ncbi:ABC transporter permease [Verrucosispora sp. WMMD1129]|uniref:ABC transporter permease n=1 Tax=Verrucosispora sp. WMMD1129 TaxID=3016093 RepID=UPI00249A4A8D|nr:ABC transporter permease [Verrucosispora sp. WMMD1129]WFE47883.1 ABC transporter permease [Verrucosispora sp. WMMD1129]